MFDCYGRRAGLFVALVFFQVLFFFDCEISIADDLIPVGIEVNHQRRGDALVLFRKNGDVWLPKPFFDTLQTSLPIGHYEKDGDKKYVSLFAFGSRVRFDFDNDSLLLKLDINPYFLKPNIIEYAKDPVVSTITHENSLFVNYAFNYQANDYSEFDSWEIPLEVVASTKGYVIKSNYLYRDILGQAYWSRGLSQLVADKVAKRQRFVFGDFIANTGVMGGAGIFAGFSLSRNLDIHPGVVNSPGLSLQGVLSTPSHVEVYANDVLMRSENLPAGEFELKDIPNVYGSGEARVVVTDAFGREKTFHEDYYVSSRLLRRGIHEYSYNVGWRRNQLDSEIVEYESKPTLLVRHSVGLTPGLTLGYRFENDQDVLNTRVSTQFLIQHYGELGIIGAYSHYLRKNAYGLSFNYSYVGKHLHLRSNVVLTTPRYAHVSYKPQVDVTNVTQNYSIGFHGLKYGSFSFIYTQARQVEELTNALLDNREIWSVVYNQRVSRRVHMFVRASQIYQTEQTENNFLFGINAVFGTRSSSSYTFNQQGEFYQNSVMVQKSAPLGAGYGLRVRGLTDEQTQASEGIEGEVALLAKAKHGQLSGNYFRQHGYQNYQARLAGSVVMMSSRTFFSRPIYDSFGLAKIGNLDNVDVYLASEYMGKSDQGQLLIPNLSSYSQNNVRIDSEDLPVDISLDTTVLPIVPAYRSGAIADFKIARFQAVTGKIIFDDFGEKKIPEFGNLKLLSGNIETQGVIGKGGEFYFENIAAGKYHAELLLRGQSCRFQMEIPKSTEMMIELGEISCAR